MEGFAGSANPHGPAETGSSDAPEASRSDEAAAPSSIGRPPPSRADTSLLLKTLSIAGGRSRAGSLAGWESLEGYENAISELTSEATTLTNVPFGLKPIPASALPDTRGRQGPPLSFPCTPQMRCSSQAAVIRLICSRLLYPRQGMQHLKKPLRTISKDKCPESQSSTSYSAVWKHMDALNGA